MRSYLDDVIVYGKSQEKHDCNLRAVSNASKPWNEINDKCEFNVETIRLLGHVISKDGILPAPT